MTDDRNSKNLSVRMMARGMTGGTEMPQFPIPEKLPALGGRYGCPVDACFWNFDVPESTFDTRMNDDGSSITHTVSGADPEHVGRVLGAHFAGHTPEEYLRTISRLNQALSRAMATVERMVAAEEANAATPDDAPAAGTGRGWAGISSDGGVGQAVDHHAY